MPRRKRGMQEDRIERVNAHGANGDTRSGDEGLDDPAISRTHRDDMSATPMQGDRLTEDMELDENMSNGNRQESQRSHRTNQRANDERYDSAAGFSGQGAQMEGSAEEAEGTGYTDDASDKARTARHRRDK
ncbi:MAG TPA: hypothetical protein VGC44_04075 [Longimicrobiales bacterium]